MRVVQGQSFEITRSISAQANVTTDGGDQPIETITLNGESLCLGYIESQIVPAALTLTPDDENLVVEVEMCFSNGKFDESAVAPIQLRVKELNSRLPAH